MVRHAPVRVALLGLGRMGIFHQRALRERLPDVRVVAVAEPRADVAASIEGDAAVYSDSRPALEHPGVEACIVVTPTDTHAEVVAAALERGIHVFCEKPLTLEAERSRTLSELARRRGLVLQVGFWRRFCPPIVEARRRVQAGDVGVPILVRSSQWDVDGPSAAWCDPARSGGVFVDMGVHEFDEIEWMIDQRAEQVEGRPLTLVKQELADVGDYDNVLALIKLSGGATGLIDLSRNGRYADDIRIEVLGSEGAVFVDTHPRSRVQLGTRDGLATVWEAAGDGFLDALANELAAFTRAASGLPIETELPGAAESVRATELGNAARESARSGRPVEVGS